MRISQISTTPLYAFRAKLTRNTEYAKDAEGKPCIKSTTKKDLISSYNNRIQALRVQRDAAIELDNFMRSDKMKRCLDKLPKQDEIEMISKFETMNVQDDGTVEFNPICLMYKFEDPKSQKAVKHAEYLGSNKADELSMCYVQNEDGSINKKKIITYIVDIARFLGVK